MSPKSCPADLYDRVTGYAAEQRFWQSVAARFDFDESGDLTGSALIPLTLGFGLDRSKRGCPVRADDSDSAVILEQLDQLSRPFDTWIEMAKDDSGHHVGQLRSL